MTTRTTLAQWYECLGYGDPTERTELPKICTDPQIQAGPGAFGFYPLYDRSEGGGAAGPKRPPYYLAVVIAESNALSGIPEYLRIVLKPVTDIIMGGGDAINTPRAKILAAGGGLLRRDVDFIRESLESCECRASRETGEPYAALTKGQPADRKKVSRYDLLEDGEGATLWDIASAAKEVGECTCKGRAKVDPNENRAVV